MPDFMRQHPGEFGLAARFLNQAAIDVNEAAGQRKRIDVVRVNHLELIGDIRPARRLREPLAERVDIILNIRLIKNSFFGFDFGSGLRADLNFHVLRDEIESSRQIAETAGLVGASRHAHHRKRDKHKHEPSLRQCSIHSPFLLHAC